MTDGGIIILGSAFAVSVLGYVMVRKADAKRKAFSKFCDLKIAEEMRLVTQVWGSGGIRKQSTMWDEKPDGSLEWVGPYGVNSSETAAKLLDEMKAANAEGWEWTPSQRTNPNAREE